MRIFGPTGRPVAAVGQGSWKIEASAADAAIAGAGHPACNQAALSLELSDAELARIDAAFPRGAPPRGLTMI